LGGAAAPTQGGRPLTRHAFTSCSLLVGDRQLGKFLAAVEKDGLIKTKEAKGVISITAVNRTHERCGCSSDND